VSDKPKRRWYQFGLMHMLLALTGVCLVPGGIVAYFQNESARQRAAVRDFERMRGTIRYDETVPPRPDIVRSLLGDDSFSRIIGVSFLPNTIVIYDKSWVGHEEFRTPEEHQHPL